MRRCLSKAILTKLLGLPEGEQLVLPMDAIFRVSILGAVQEASEQKVRCVKGALGIRVVTGIQRPVSMHVINP